MKKYLCLLILVFLFSQNVNAQNAFLGKPFKLFTGIGFSEGFNFKGSIFSVEPSYTFSSFRAGIRLEVAHKENMMDASSVSSLVSLDYYWLAKTNFRISSGGGIGTYNPSTSSGCSPSPSTVSMTSANKNFGGMLRTNLETGHLYFGFEYNFAPSVYVSAVDVDGHITATEAYPSSYFGVKFGFVFGGGKRK